MTPTRPKVAAATARLECGRRINVRAALMGLVLVRASVWSTEQVSLAMHHCALGSLLLGTGEGGGEAKEATKGQLEERRGGGKVRVWFWL